MDKEFILNLSNKANITLISTEVEHMVKELTLFNQAMSELYYVDTSNFKDEEEVTKTLDILRLRHDN